MFLAKGCPLIEVRTLSVGCAHKHLIDAGIQMPGVFFGVNCGICCDCIAICATYFNVSLIVTIVGLEEGNLYWETTFIKSGCKWQHCRAIS